MPIEDEFNPSADNPFVGKQASRPERQVDAPVQLSDAPKPTLKDHWDDLNTGEKVKFGLLTTGAASLAAMAIIGGPEIADRLNGPEYNHETTTITVEQGGDWYGVAESIPGHELADTRDVIAHLKADPANAGIADIDILQPGMTITVPIDISK